MHAYDANNGRQLWSWTVVPAAGAPGSNTWAATDTHYGGGAMWETPVIDPKLNLAIFGTGNPVPWNSRGPGTNLYTDSIVALNVYTGQLVWALPDGAPRPVGLGPAEQRRPLRTDVQAAEDHDGQDAGQGQRQVRDEDRRRSRSSSRRSGPVSRSSTSTE